MTIPLGLYGAARPVASGGWTPASLTGLLAWWDADDPATIAQSEGAVSQWDDKSGSGLHVSQATASARPTTGVTTQNGRNVLVFDGNDVLARSNADSLKWLPLHDGTDYLIGVVAMKATSGNQGIFSTMEDGIAAARPGAWLYVPGATLNHTIMNSAGSAVGNAADSFVTNGTPFLTTLLADPDNATAANRSALFKNGGSAIKNNTSTAAPSTGINTTRPLIIGSLKSDSYNLNGWIAEIVVATGSEATEENRVLLRDYLNAKWGIY